MSISGLSVIAESGEVSSEQLFRVHPLPAGLSRIEFSGNLPLGWAGSLAHGLSDLNINILSGYAKRKTISAWEGEFVVDPINFSSNMPEIDFVGLANKRVSRTTALHLSLTTFIVKECFRENGSVYVEINGCDQVGFLAAVLKKFASCGLYPWDFSVLTKKNVIFDKFHLMGPAGVKASKGTVRSLEHKLKECTM